MRVWISSVVVLGCLACGAVYPELTPPVKAPPPGRALEPPPPRDLLYVDFVSAEIPPRTRDGREWDTMGGSAPDPFAKLFVDDREVIRTPLQSNTLKPTWPDQKRANYFISAKSKIRVELWDSNPINNHPICVKRVFELHDSAGPVPIDIDCDSGAHVRLRVEPAHARWGLGFSYELRTGAAGITRVQAQSPAARAGITANDDIIEVQGKKVGKMEEGEVQSAVNANAPSGVELLLRGADGTERKVAVKEGVIYPAVEDEVPLD